MDTRTSTYDGYRHARQSDIQPVSVTRWTARLSDPQIERDYRIDRLPEERRRCLFLMVLASAAGSLNLLVEIYAYSKGTTTEAAFVPPFIGIWMPLIGLAVISRLRSPAALEAAMVLAAVVGTATRLGVVTLHPHLTYLWPTLMIGVLFVIYLYLPVRFVVALVLAGVFSVVTPTWWKWSLGDALPPDQFYRGLVWLSFANALGFIAANSLQRSQRIQYAQSLVLRQLLSTDSMTGIGNRRRFDDMLAREWRRCSRSGRPLSLLMIDVDHFKAYNDHCGHLQGDECLRRVAQLLVASVGRPGDLVARYGGEEFVCLLPEIGEAGARAVAEKIMDALEKADIVHPALASYGRLTISIGVATAVDLSGRQAASLVALADRLLYSAKGAGRARLMSGLL